MVLPIVLILIGTIIFLISVVTALHLVPPLAESFSAVLMKAFSSVSGIAIILYGIWKALPDEIKGFVAKGLRKIPNLPIYYKRTTVKFELESEINAALKEFSKEGAGFVQHEIVVSWLTPKDEARRLFFRGGKAYIKIDFAEDKERNLVEALVVYCNDCLLPEIRQYTARPLMRAVDLTFIDELLDRRNAVRGRAFFTQEVIPRELLVTPEIDKYLGTLELLSQHGLFIRILLPELQEYPGRTHRKIARQTHLEQMEAFIDFLKITAEDRTNLVKRAWLHIGETIRTGVVLVGIAQRLQDEGTKPYVTRTARDNVDGARTVYLIGYNMGATYVRTIAEEVKRHGIADKYEIYEYDALIGGELKKQSLARLSMLEGAGKRFLESFPCKEEWADLANEADTVVMSTMDSIVAETPAKEKTVTETPVADIWELKLDAAWSKRANKSGQIIHGSLAAADAVKVLSVNKLNESPYKTLKSLLEASHYLSTRWSRIETWIIRI